MTRISDNEGFTIAGLAVHTLPTRLNDVESTINNFTGVEVHASDPIGKLVVTVEEPAGEKIMVDTITRINQVDGVIATALVYSHQVD